MRSRRACWFAVCLAAVAVCLSLPTLLSAQGTTGRIVGRVADPGRVVAHDQDPQVPLVLEGAHALERDRLADVDVARRRVDPELHPQRPAERELALELSLRQHLDGVTCERSDVRHGSRMISAG